LFDDVAAVRLVRAPLRTVGAALESGDLATASSRFASFKTRWPEVKPLISARSADTAAETQSALDAADQAMAAPSINPTVAGPLVSSLLDRYNVGVNLLTTAARNAE
jgi:hypothetical protein